MGNMIDYLHWRGDLTLKQSPFCDADNLVLSMLSYVELDGIVPGPGSRETVTAEEANRAFFSRHTEEEVQNGKSLIHLTPFILKAMAGSKRFSQAELCNYVNHIDVEKALQFSAMHIRLSDGTVFISYRGTDDTLIGWREDCDLSLGQVPAQREAVEYLVKTTRGNKPRYRIGGQSKGGNLAVYAASQCPEPVRERIICVYNNDGPGFLDDVIASEGYAAILPRTRMIVPEESTVGMLFAHREPLTVIESTQTSLMQHDAMTWQILGENFVTKSGLSERAQMINDALARWIGGLSTEERKTVIEAIFSTLAASGATTLEGIANGGLKSIAGILTGIREVDAAAKPLFARLGKELTLAAEKKYLPDLLRRLPHRPR